MSLKTNYFKLGLFIICSTVLLLSILVFFGLGALNKDKIMMESYFDESVQGLDIGSPLKFKGVKIGSVQRIRFVFNKYHDIKDVPFRYVLVEMALDPDSAIALKSREDLKDAIWSEVENGLRVRIAPQGLPARWHAAGHAAGIHYVPLRRRASSRHSSHSGLCAGPRDGGKCDACTSPPVLFRRERCSCYAHGVASP